MRLVDKYHPAISSTSTEIPQGEDVRLLVNALWTNMTMHRGIGLAANQIGIPQRAIVVHAGPFRQEFINPVITRCYGGASTSREGCLSFPGLSVPVVRSKQIVVEGFDVNWKPIKRKLKGLAARCVQHEVDHLNGVTIG